MLVGQNHGWKISHMSWIQPFSAHTEVRQIERWHLGRLLVQYLPPMMLTDDIEHCVIE